MGAREKESKTQGPSPKAAGVGSIGARNASPVQDQMELPAKAPVATESPAAILEFELTEVPTADAKIPAFFMGKRVAYMAILLRRAGFFMPEEHGYHELTRIIVGSDGKVRCSERLDNKVGPGLVQRVSVTAEGLYVETHIGVLFAPMCDIQVTYRL